MSSAVPTPNTPESAEPKKKGGCLKWGAIGAAVLLLIGIIGGMGNDDKGTNADSTSETSTTAKSVEETTAVESTTEVPTSSSEKAPAASGPVDAMPWLTEQFGGMTTTEVLLADPTSWYGYVSAATIEQGNMHVRLQVDRKQDKDLGTDAANAVSNFIAFSDDPLVEDVSFAIAEDGAGTVIDQKMVRR